MLYAKIKRAGIASARIKRIDTSAAEAMPGVMAVLTGREIPVNSFGPTFQDQPVLADEIVSPRRRRRRRGGGRHRADRQRGARKDRRRIRAAAGGVRSARGHARGCAQGACAQQQHLRHQGDPQRRRREGLCRVRPYLRGPVQHADGRARAARAARGDRRLGRQRPPHACGRRSGGSRSRAPTSRAR